MTGWSFVPVIVNLTVVATRSALSTVNSSLRVSPARSACTEASPFFSVYVQAPEASTSKVP